jgi:hypothetical protein
MLFLGYKLHLFSTLNHNHVQRSNNLLYSAALLLNVVAVSYSGGPGFSHSPRGQLFSQLFMCCFILGWCWDGAVSRHCVSTLYLSVAFDLVSTRQFPLPVDSSFTWHSYTLLRACSHASGFSLLMALRLFCKPAIHRWFHNYLFLW